MPAKKPVEYCPDCFMFDGLDEPLIIRPNAKPSCGRGHRWDNLEMDELDQKISLANRKRATIQAQGPAKDPDQAEAQPQTPEPPAKPPKPIPQDKSSKVSISVQDIERLSGLIGGFSDSGTLFGRVFALKADLDEARAQIATLQAAKMQVAAGGKELAASQTEANGDLIVSVIVPEQHVQPLREIAEANGTSLELYFNAIIENGLSNGWFF